MKSKDRLNLGCGSDVRESFVNVDYVNFPGVDVVCDLNKLPYPFKENFFEEVVMRNVLEHLENPLNVLKEVRRISKPGARVFIKGPHFSSDNVWGDLEHKRGFSSQTFTNKNLSNFFKVINQRITFSHFKFFMRPFARLNPLFYEKHLAFIFQGVDVEVELEVLK
jgi:ubiquinone/menaquinone biosynthesis C-methylase UbiE